MARSTGVALRAGLSPRGTVAVEVVDDPGVNEISGAIADRIVAAFGRGVGSGLLHLGAVEVDTELPPSLAFWRDLGTRVVSAICARAAPDESTLWEAPEPDRAVLEELAASVPPMRGGELVTAESLEGVWVRISEAAAQVATERAEGLQGYLDEAHSVWHVAGRVCLHLAENPRDPELPFAFVATYARKPPSRTTIQHVPLGHALKEYADARDKPILRALLQPLQRAARDSELIRDLVESGDIYHPLAWDAEEAHRLLVQAETLERAGLVVRLPDWWRSRRRRRPSVSVTIGEVAPSTLGLSALLDFDVRVTLDGEPLDANELAAVLDAQAGLLLIKGRWVEVDPEKLAEVLEHWERVQAEARAGGVSFAEGMRMLAGTEGLVDEDDARPDWSTVVAGGWLTEQLDALRSPEVAQSIAESAGLRAELRPYQKVGVQWLWTLHGLGLGGCLADDMGLGKTIQVIALLSLLHTRETRPTDGEVDLLVVPASLVDNWRAELARFAPDLRVLVAHPSAIPSKELKSLPSESVRACQVVITTYGTVLRTSWMAEFPWRATVLDEAQAIKNPAAKQTRAVKKLRTRWRLALTGTPVENRLGDLWSIFDFLNPGLLGTAAAFRRLCDAMSTRADDGYAPLRRLVAPYVLRRLKTDRRILTDLPDKTELKTYCLLTRTQAALYQQAVAELRAALKEDEAEGIERRGLVLASLLRFKQICNHPSQWLGDGSFEASQSGKFLRLAALCAPIADRQDKALVFTQFRAMTGPLRRHLAACFGRDGLVLHGGVPVARRSEIVRRFQEDEQVPFMVLSLKAGGTGLNLTAANHVVHFDRWWNPAVENQATDRVFRIGQHRNVLVHKFVCKGTVEERIDTLIEEKQKLSDQVLTGGAETALTEMSNEELLALVQLDLQSAVTS